MQGNTKEGSMIPHSTSPFRQQSMLAWRPFLTPAGAAIVYICFAGVSLLFGLLYHFANQNVFEQEIRYDNLGGSPVVTLKVDRDLVDTQLFVYLKLTRFYQNSFLYGSSKNWDQWEGEYVEKDDLGKCEPLLMADKSNVLAPCGALPLSIFNDTFTFDNNLPAFTSKGIAIEGWSKLFKHANSKYSAEGRWLADNDAFPGGQTNERFMNWVHLAPFATFRKLWAKTDDKITVKKGEYEIAIDSVFPVSSYGGEKSIVISEVSWTGGKNAFLGIFFLSMFGLCILLAIVFAILYFTNAMPLYSALVHEEHCCSETEQPLNSGD